MRVHVRAMRAADLAVVATIERRITKTKRVSSLRRHLAAMLRSRLGVCLVAEIGGTVGGFLVGDVAPWEFGEEREVAWIKAVGVDPRHQGTGLGKRLGDAFLAELRRRGIRRGETLVEWDSGDLVAYFQSLGVDPAGAGGLQRRG